MALADKLVEIDTIVNDTKCNYQILLDNMPEEDRKALLTAWEKGYSQRVILRALRSEGYKTSNEAIAGHKAGTCKCNRRK